MRTPLTISAGLAGSAFLAGTLVYVALDALVPNVFVGLFRMNMYHEAYPVGYITILSVVFGLVGAGWVRWAGHLRGWRRWTSAFAAIIVTVLAASVPGGVLWVFHDMAAGFVPSGAQFWRSIRWGMANGPAAGWLIALWSIPYNLIGIAFGVFALDRAARVWTRASAAKRISV